MSSIYLNGGGGGGGTESLEDAKNNGPITSTGTIISGGSMTLDWNDTTSKLTLTRLSDSAKTFIVDLDGNVTAKGDVQLDTDKHIYWGDQTVMIYRSGNSLILKETNYGSSFTLNYQPILVIGHASYDFLVIPLGNTHGVNVYTSVDPTSGNCSDSPRYIMTGKYFPGGGAVTELKGCMFLHPTNATGPVSELDFYIDATKECSIDSAGIFDARVGYSVGGVAGVSGSFTSADGTPKTITVVNGIITSIV
jgi:hypothetical protein